MTQTNLPTRDETTDDLPTGVREYLDGRSEIMSWGTRTADLTIAFPRHSRPPVGDILAELRTHGFTTEDVSFASQRLKLTRE